MKTKKIEKIEIYDYPEDLETYMVNGKIVVTPFREMVMNKINELIDAVNSLPPNKGRKEKI